MAASDNQQNNNALELPMQKLRISNCRLLPAELWANVCAHVNDFDLWVTCRQVSRTLRAEAEQEFAKTRLPLLKVSWYCNSSVTFQGKVFGYDGSACSDSFDRFSEDGFRAQFKASFDYEIYDNVSSGDPGLDWSAEKREVGHESAKNAFFSALCYPDIDIRTPLLEYTQGEKVWQSVQLNSCFSTVQIPAFEVNPNTEMISFEWREFIENLYKDSAYVRKRRYQFDTGDSLSEDIEDRAERSLSYYWANSEHGTMDSWKRYFGEENDVYLEEAYIKRLKASHAKAGASLNLNAVIEGYTEQEFRKAVQEYIKGMNYRRNHYLFKDYMVRHGIKV